LADLIKYAFVAGEVAPTLWARSDLEKYDLALALCKNWFVDYRGGLSTRGGSRFIDYVKEDDKPTKFFPFKFAPAINQTYVMLFGHNYIRFIQDGAYVVESPVTITAISTANPGVVSATAHGYADGDWVKITATGMTELNGRTFVVANQAANTFELTDPLTGANIDTTGYTTFISGTVARIYTIVTTYDSADLALLRAHQSRSVIYLTHQDYPAATLTRTAHTNWTLADVVFGNSVGRPAATTVDAGAGTAGVGFQVTAIDADGVESLPSDYGFDSTAVDYSSTAGQAKVTWTAVAGAVYYRVYRTNIIPTGSQVSRAMAVGFVGIAYGNQFIDTNIIPDFTVTPPNHVDPFANGAIDYIEVTAPGAGYTSSSAVSITTATGSGFVGYAVVNSAGDLLAIGILNGGAGYVSGDTVVVSVGAGATFTKTLSPASGNNPGASSVFQQRKVYAATENDPLTIWASRPGDYENMDISTIIQDDDSYEFELDSEEVAPVRHLLATRSGLVIISQAGIWQLSGGNGGAVTPSNALADPQSYTGCSIIPPLPIDTDILYIEGKGGTARLLSYNDYTKVFAGQDLSILSNHLTPPTKPLGTWTYASDPFKLVYATRSDGIIVCMTLVKEQNIYGWATMQTKGLYKDVLAIQEDVTDVVYTMAQRYVNGRYTKMIETQVRRNFVEVEDAWCVDSGVANTPTYPAADLTISASSGTAVTFTASAAVFSAGDVGKVLRAGGGKAIINTYTDTTHVIGNLMRDVTAVMPEDPADTPLPVLEGDWTLDTPIMAVTGLWHLEGQTVKILADGNVLPDAVVTDGSITLTQAATRIIAGLGYSCVAQTLPPTTSQGVIEGRRKRSFGVKARLYNSRGLKSGTNLTRLYPMKEHTDEAYNEPTRLQAGVKPLFIQDAFNYDGQVYYVQDDPLPATILGLITDLQVGDALQKN
jgi:hypothetical protein